jgi:hypothetical protein
MKITVFTSNQPRHLALVNRVAKVSEMTFAVLECNTVFPGKIKDFYRSSPQMKDYFANVISAEQKIFDQVSFLDENVRTLSVKSGDLNLLDRMQLELSLDSDLYIVFGASFIKGWLIKFLVENRALNIHMGLSPYYRGSSCNFWALYDNRPEYVGATIHLLSEGLDSGPILYHAVPNPNCDNIFDFTMSAVDVAQLSLVRKIRSGEIRSLQPEIQRKIDELRYTRNDEFNDQISKEFLSRQIDMRSIREHMQSTAYPKLVRPEIA